MIGTRYLAGHLGKRLCVAPQTAIAPKIGHMIRATLSGSVWVAWKQVQIYKRSATSPWLEKPREGWLRGIDFYRPGQLVWVIAHAMRRYRIVHGSYPNLINPTTFSEKLFWSKFFGEVRHGIAGNKLRTLELIPEEIRSLVHAAPVVWRSHVADLPSNDQIEPGYYYLKASHGSGFFRRIRFPLDGADRKNAVSLTRKWLRKDYGVHHGEWWYRCFDPEIFLEKDVCGDDTSISWNFLVINQAVPQIGLNLKRADGPSQATWLNSDFEPLIHKSSLPEVEDFVLPSSRREMLTLARRIGKEFSCVRVDFLSGKDNRAYLCEITFIPGNALTIRPLEIEMSLFHLWGNPQQ